MRCMLLLVSIVAFSLLMFAAAPFDHEPTSPYEWRVFVKFSASPKLTNAVKAQFLKDMKAALGPALGDDLGTVTLRDLADVPADKRDRLVSQFAEVGWKALGSDEFRTLTGVKTHFLTVEYRSGAYHLESSQHDGSTGLSTPQVRKKTVTDTDALSRTAGLMLVEDFGPVATVEPLADAKEFCLIRLRGMELPGIDRWLKRGDVFAMSTILDLPKPLPKDAKPEKLKPGQVLEIPTERKAQPRSSTLLRVTEVIDRGVAKCEVFSIYERAFPRQQRLVGYRAMKLSTVDGPIAVTVSDSTGQAPKPNVPLEVWATEYGGLNVKPNARDSLEGRGGRYGSPRKLRGAAFVWIKLGQEQSRFVVPILTTGDPLPLTFQFDEGKVRLARFQDRVERFVSRTIDARLAIDQLGLALKDLIEKQENKKALDRTEIGLKTLEERDKDLSAELAELRGDANAKDAYIAANLNNAEQLIASLRVVKPELEAKREDLKVSLAKAEDPIEFEKKFRAKEIQRQIATFERRGEIPEALEQYDLLIELTKLEDARKRKAKLEEDWKAKSPEQETARSQIKIDWANLAKLDDVKAAVPQLAKGLEILGKADDKYGLRYGLTGIENAVLRLSELANPLDKDFAGDREQIAAIDAVRKELLKIADKLAADRKRIGDG